MIIVSQDKERIINFNKVEILGINIDDKLQIACSFNEGQIVLGTYKTEERAKEVLGEIINIYKATEAFKVVSGRVLDSTGAVAINKGFVYEMPKE